MSAKEIAVEAEVRLFELEGVVASYTLDTRSDGSLFTKVITTDGEEMTLPCPTKFGGNWSPPVAIGKGQPIAIRAFVVPARDTKRESATFGAIIDSKRYVAAESGKLADCMTRDEYLASPYSGKPVTGQQATSEVRAF
jgi:hypothetical protein